MDLQDQIDVLDPRGLTYALISGYNKQSSLSLLLGSHTDARVSYLRQIMAEEMCNDLEDVDDEQIMKVIYIQTVLKSIQGKHIKDVSQMLKLF